MKEIEDIDHAFARAQRSGMRTALATVVWVEGSSYRRPGARMLVSEDGALTGAISGGCLEGDALRKALFCIEQRKNKLVIYDTADDDGVFGIQLGCNGVIRLLLEPILPQMPFHPLQLLQRLRMQRRPGVLVTLFYRDAHAPRQPGTCLLYLEHEYMESGTVEAALRERIRADADKALRLKQSFFSEYAGSSGPLTAFIEYIAPAVSLVVAGAGNDAAPLVEMAVQLGWHVTVIDGRYTHATAQRFAKAKAVYVVKPGDVIPGFLSDEQTAFMLMTHNYRYDLALLKRALMHECFYIGVLGPKKKLELMLSQLEADGVTVGETQKGRIFGPAGLDIGAETAEEIALSVVAEIQAVLYRRRGLPLREKAEPVHSRPQHASMEDHNDR